MNRLPSRRPFPLPNSKLKVVTMHIKKFLLKSVKKWRWGLWRKARQKLFFFLLLHNSFCKLPKHSVVKQGWRVWGRRAEAQLRQTLCGMKYMHNAERDQQADKLTTPEPWHSWHLDTHQSVFYTVNGWEEDMQRQDRSKGVFFTLGSFGQLSLIWDLQVTLCPHGCLLSGARFMEWDSWVFSLWLAGLWPAMHIVL